MGLVKPADIVPVHDEYYPSIKLRTFQNLVRLAKEDNNSMLLIGLTQVIIDDIQADLSAGNVDSVKIKNYYRTYLNALDKVQSIDNTLLGQLKELLG